MESSETGALTPSSSYMAGVLKTKTKQIFIGFIQRIHIVPGAIYPIVPFTPIDEVVPVNVDEESW